MRYRSQAEVVEAIQGIGRPFTVRELMDILYPDDEEGYEKWHKKRRLSSHMTVLKNKGVVGHVAHNSRLWVYKENSEKK